MSSEPLLPAGSGLGYAMGFALKKILKWMLIVVGFLAGMFFVGVELLQGKVLQMLIVYFPDAGSCSLPASIASSNCIFTQDFRERDTHGVGTETIGSSMGCKTSDCNCYSSRRAPPSTAPTLSTRTYIQKCRSLGLSEYLIG
jgi:hypothetical protein